MIQLPAPMSRYTYRPLKRGLVGYDVWALQLNLPGLTADGDFGPQTENAVVTYQEQHFPDASDHDGIAGIRTQQSILLVRANPAQQQYRTPVGLIRGIIEGESGWQIPAVSLTYSNGSRDCGPVQINLNQTQLKSESALATAFNGRVAASVTLDSLRFKKDAYAKLGHGDRDAWWFAIGYHNWPAAADRFGNGTISTWVYRARDPYDGVTKSYKMSDSAGWIKAIGVPGVETGYEWFNFYVSSKAAYVKHWTP